VTDRLPGTPEGIQAAADLLAGGSVVAFPTDTVHGLACRPGDPIALERVFTMKGRPPDRRVAWLVTDLEQAEGLGLAIDDRARTVADALWPGGITLVLPTAGDDPPGTLGVRAPDHPITQSLLDVTGPLPVTSANPHGFPECFTTDDVLIAFAGAADLVAVIEGDSPGHQASTVLDLSQPRAHILRTGAIDRQRLEALIGPID
jgi:tRNA threonylcarbamoyl adenosine modification protein (Sua5/YciO/YrdC/YwlC family)